MKIDYPLYVQLLNHRSHTGTKAQKKYARWLRAWIKANVPGCQVSTDKAGNIYVTKGEAAIYPAMTSHIDINQQERPHVQVVRSGDWITGLDLDTGLQCGVGHDDKAGNLMMLQMLRVLPALKCLFTVDEECGGIGADAANLAFFDDCTFVIEPDRNAYDSFELITYSGGIEMASQAFIDAASDIMARYAFKESAGVFTDVNVLKDNGLDICAFNITAGYFDEHSDRERLYVPAWENSAAFTLELFSQLADRQWPHTAPPWSWSEPNTSGNAKLIDFDGYSWAKAKRYKCPDCGADIQPEDVYKGTGYCQACGVWDVVDRDLLPL